MRSEVVAADSCELHDGCMRGPGRRTLLELRFTLRNEGGAAVELGRPDQNAMFYPSLCQHEYVLDGFFDAELRDDSGESWRTASSRPAASPAVVPGVVR